MHAISAETGATAWVYEQRAATMSLAATGGGLVFGGDVNGRFRAFDDRTGEVLWEINLGSSVSGFPITYAVDGRQYVAGSTGTPRFINLTPELRPSLGNNLCRVRTAGGRGSSERTGRSSAHDLAWSARSSRSVTSSRCAPSRRYSSSRRCSCTSTIPRMSRH